MQRCLQLAALSAHSVAPNPMVGAVLVHEGRIIGEGYHQQYGKAHAEVNCLQSVKEEDHPLIPASALYVSLEPCAHFGKTPPCADLIIRHRISKVVVGIRDPFVMVAGKGIEKLLAAGVKVIVGVLEAECRKLNKRFFYFQKEHQPFVILKWAQSLDEKIGVPHRRLLISNEFTNRLVHKWRSEEMAILVGTHTALADDPSLTTRLWPGPNPIRLLVDMDLKLPSSLNLLNGEGTTIIFNLQKHTLPREKPDTDALKKLGVVYYQVTGDVSLVQQILNALYQLNIQSLLVEGGARLLQSFIEEGAWNEARVITNDSLVVGEGLPAPLLNHHHLNDQERISGDTIRYYWRRSS